MISALLSLFFVTSALAYVPTVESLFRFGGNPDVTTNAAVVSFVVRKIDEGTSSGEGLVQRRSEEYYRLYLTKEGIDTLKIAQAKYGDASFSDNALVHRIYFPNFTPHTLKPSLDQMEKGLFLSLVHSMVFNNGSQLVTYLKGLSVPVSHNADLINREKIEYLASYKRYLKNIAQNRNARKNEENPLRPDDPAARERVQKVMDESMYVDTGHVKLGRDEGRVAWLVSAGAFESVHAYDTRAVQKYRYKSPAGEYLVVAKDYWMPNGTHLLPRHLFIRDFKGENYQVEFIDLKHFVEKDEDFGKRIQRWDQILRGKEDLVPRPEFLL